MNIIHDINEVDTNQRQRFKSVQQLKIALFENSYVRNYKNAYKNVFAKS